MALWCVSTFTTVFYKPYVELLLEANVELKIA